LHVLVNNAGIFNMGSNKREITSKDGLEAHMATNHLGHFLLTVKLLPCLAEGARSPAAVAAAAVAGGRNGYGSGNGKKNTLPFPSRVVSVSSALHAFADGRALAADPQLFVRGYSATAAYANSKLAQVMFTAELRRRIGAGGEVSEQQQQQQGTNAAATAAVAARRSIAPSSLPPPPPIVAVAVHPGEVLTEVVRSLPAPVVKLYRALMSTLLLTPQEGARAAVFAATASAAASGNDGDGDNEGSGSSFFGGSELLASAWDPAKCYLFPDCRPHPPAPSVLDPVLGRWLWGYSAAKVGL
jgi:retinol dehydrogenase-12